MRAMTEARGSWEAASTVSSSACPSAVRLSADSTSFHAFRRYCTPVLPRATLITVQGRYLAAAQPEEDSSRVRQAAMSSARRRVRGRRRVQRIFCPTK